MYVDISETTDHIPNVLLAEHQGPQMSNFIFLKTQKSLRTKSNSKKRGRELTGFAAIVIPKIKRKIQFVIPAVTPEMNPVRISIWRKKNTTLMKSLLTEAESAKSFIRLKNSSWLILHGKAHFEK